MNTNRMNWKISIVNFALALLIGTSLFTVAQPPFARGGQGGPGGGMPGGGDFVGRFARVLNLTDAQKTQVAALREQAETAAQPYRDQIAPLQAQIQKLIEAPAFDESAARALGNQMNQLQIELHLLHAKTQNAIYNLLTTEQKAKLTELRSAMKERRDGNDDANTTTNEGRRGGFNRPRN